LARRRSWQPTPATARISPNAGAHLVTRGERPEAGERRRSVLRGDRGKSDFSPEKVAYFLLDPHPKMPNFPLNRTEAADIAAYIGSLRK